MIEAEMNGAPGAVMPVEVEVVEVEVPKETKKPVKCRRCGTGIVLLPDDRRQGYCHDCLDLAQVPSGGQKNAVLARFDLVREMIQKADPKELGVAIRKLDAYRRYAAAKQWVDVAAEADAWSLQAKWKVGEIVESTPSGTPLAPSGARPGGGRTFQSKGSPRAEIRRTIGISEYESLAWQTFRRTVPEDFLIMYLANVRSREAEPTVAGTMAAYAKTTAPEIYLSRSKPKVPDDRLIDRLVKADQLLAVATIERIGEIEDPGKKYFAIEAMAKTERFLHEQLEKMRIPVGPPLPQMLSSGG